MGSVLYRCRLTGNSSRYNGAGAFQSTLYNCVLENNSSHNNGGGADGSILYSCKLTGNDALGEGGWGGGASFSTLYNCILTGNSAGQYGGGALRIVSLRLHKCFVRSRKNVDMPIEPSRTHRVLVTLLTPCHAVVRRLVAEQKRDALMAQIQ